MQELLLHISPSLVIRLGHITFSGTYSLDIDDVTRSIANLGQPSHRKPEEPTKTSGTPTYLPPEGGDTAPLPLSRIAQCGTPRRPPTEVGIQYLTYHSVLYSNREHAVTVMLQHVVTDSISVCFRHTDVIISIQITRISLFWLDNPHPCSGFSLTLLDLDLVSVNVSSTCKVAVLLWTTTSPC